MLEISVDDFLTFGWILDTGNFCWGKALIAIVSLRIASSAPDLTASPLKMAQKPWKIQPGSLKRSPSLKSGKSSEPNLHDFGVQNVYFFPGCISRRKFI